MASDTQPHQAKCTCAPWGTSLVNVSWDQVLRNKFKEADNLFVRPILSEFQRLTFEVSALGVCTDIQVAETDTAYFARVPTPDAEIDNILIVIHSTHMVFTVPVRTNFVPIIYDKIIYLDYPEVQITEQCRRCGVCIQVQDLPPVDDIGQIVAFLPKNIDWVGSPNRSSYVGIQGCAVGHQIQYPGQRARYGRFGDRVVLIGETPYYQTHHRFYLNRTPTGDLAVTSKQRLDAILRDAKTTADSFAERIANMPILKAELEVELARKKAELESKKAELERKKAELEVDYAQQLANLDKWATELARLRDDRERDVVNAINKTWWEISSDWIYF